MHENAKKALGLVKQQHTKVCVNLIVQRPDMHITVEQIKLLTFKNKELYAIIVSLQKTFYNIRQSTLKRTEVYTLKKLLYVSKNVQSHLKEGDLPQGFFKYDTVKELYAAAIVGKVSGVYMLVLDQEDFNSVKQVSEHFQSSRYWICCENALVNQLLEKKYTAIHINDWLLKEQKKLEDFKAKQLEEMQAAQNGAEAIVDECYIPAQPNEIEAQPEQIPPDCYEERKTSAMANEKELPISFIDNSVVLGTGGGSIETAGPSVQYEENPHHVKKREIQKKLFSNTEWSNHKIIGIWSPTGKCGATLTSINLALAFAEMRVYTTVLEGLTTRPRLKQHLDCYTTVPKGWVSYASCIQGDSNPKYASWIYENVVFLPLTQRDLSFNWNPELIETYMTAPKITDVTFVDLPSGRFSDYMRDALHCLDEIWVMYDDNFHDLMSWKTYFQSVSEMYEVQLYGIMGRSYDFSKAKSIAENAGLAFLTSIPALDKEVMQHYYEKQPLWKTGNAKSTLFESYSVLYEHIFSEKMRAEKEFSTAKKKRKFSISNVFEKLAHKM